MSIFTPLTGVAAPLPDANIDTDIIFPARFLLLLTKTGLGEHLFHERRHSPAAGEPVFVLDRPPFDQAKILVTGRNFGSGSSREHAVWALADFGIRCVIAPSFGEIFYNNCFKNNVLPIVLSEAEVARVSAAATTGAPLSVDLAEQVIRLPDGASIGFALDAYRRRLLLLGLDEIGAILTDDADNVAAFETAQQQRYPWLYLGPDKRAFFDDLKAERDRETAINE